MKKCKKCQQEKSPESFSPDKRNKDGLQGECNDCRRESKKLARVLRAKGENIIPVESKTCNKCGTEKSSDEFFRDNGFTDGLSSICKQCKNAVTAVWREKNRAHYNEKTRKYNAKNYHKLRLCRYKLSIEDYNKMLSSQDNKCKICDAPPPEGKPLVIDHDHATGKVRGLLCYNCNRHIVILEKDELLDKALVYLGKK